MRNSLYISDSGEIEVYEEQNINSSVFSSILRMDIIMCIMEAMPQHFSLIKG